jgi:hypothetical protein
MNQSRLSDLGISGSSPTSATGRAREVSTMREKTTAMNEPERGRVPRHACRHCGATETSCESKSYLSGRDCCPDCDHDPPTENNQPKEDNEMANQPDTPIDLSDETSRAADARWRKTVRPIDEERELTDREAYYAFYADHSQHDPEHPDPRCDECKQPDTQPDTDTQPDNDDPWANIRHLDDDRDVEWHGYCCNHASPDRTFNFCCMCSPRAAAAVGLADHLARTRFVPAPDQEPTITCYRVHEPGIGSEGNHLDVDPYVMEGCTAADGIVTARLSIVSPEGVREGPDGELLGRTSVHIRTEDLPGLIAALQKITDLPEDDWLRIWSRPPAERLCRDCGYPLPATHDQDVHGNCTDEK